MRFFIALLLFCFVQEPEILEQSVVLPPCTGGWYIAEQSSEEGYDYVKLRCTNTPSEDPN